MRIIPVIDLLDGLAVHAVKGDRAHYRPVMSVLCDTPDPIMLAESYHSRLGLNEIYIADLNAIQGTGFTGHRNMIAELAGRERMDIILDAGIPNAEKAGTWLELGVEKIVIGGETLHSLDALQDIPAKISRDRLIFSLDLRAGKILSQCPALADKHPMALLELLQSAGWCEVILLDLSRVGSREGADHTLAAEACANFPDLKLLTGGGIADPKELLELKSLGISGVLAATALHSGIISARHISALGAMK
jgi:phosphoribosylformimino-5-aminoimidazole carboxamide ribotide isomerase